jgi:hypothetical protein
VDAEAEFEAWMSVYGAAYENPAGLSSLRCPNGDLGRLRLLFVVYDVEFDVGQAYFWCETCKTGLMPLRAPIAPGAEQVLRGMFTTPDFRMVTPV